MEMVGLAASGVSLNVAGIEECEEILPGTGWSPIASTEYRELPDGIGRTGGAGRFERWW